MATSLPSLNKALALKPEPQLTPSLKQLIARENARGTVSDYLFTPALRSYAKRIFECAIHGKGQGFWVQAEYGAGKTSFLGTILCLLMWGQEEKVWEVLRDEELRKEYEHAISKVRLFPVAFSLKGLGDSRGAQFDSLMRIFEEQIVESLGEHAPELAKKVRVTSGELALEWLDKQAAGHLKVALDAYLQEHHQLTTAKFRAKHGDKKLGQELVASGLADGQLKSKYKERFTHICQQIMKLGGYTGIAFVVDEFRSWQDRHVEHSAVAGEDEDVLETLAHILPGEGVNVLTIVASQGDVPQKLSGGGKGDRFIPLLLLGDKNQSDFGEIVAFRTVEHLPGASTGIKDYFDECRNKYRFLKQANISVPDFSAIFPFQPRVFEILRRITQSAESHNLPTARSAIRMAWQAISDGKLLNEKRLVVVADLIQSDEMRKGLNSQVFRDKYQNLQTAIEQLAEFEVAPEEREQARQVRDRGMELTQARAYLTAACNLDSALELNRTALLGQLKLELLLAQPHVIGARVDSFNKWKEDYVQGYRKRHREHYEKLGKLNEAANALRPRAIALSRLNGITELGPPAGDTANVTADFEGFAALLWPCPNAVEADVHGANATCSKCGWTPTKTLPQGEHDRLVQAVTQGLGDRLLRLKDASISTVLKNAASGKKGAELKGLLEIIQLANADKLVGVMTDELAAFLRQLLQEANIVQESVALGPILQKIGAIEEDRVEEAVSEFTNLLRNAIKDAKAKHGPSKRVRVFLRVDGGQVQG